MSEIKVFLRRKLTFHMVEINLVSLLTIVIGIIAVYLSYKCIKDPKFAKKYVETNPKAFIWRKLFGVEKSVKMTRTVFAPLGVAIGILLIVIGIIYLI